ncbi:uncharacterized protein LOC110058501 [Orbicella faveolata]|uniref:uncharacterized protein LOC110058501 n=1 Tax=Orbicella faveolata TaxID=48498 RepID=UPI0009E39FBC|nr:uncharacterized protein LOC110058501 [Orbicella faveolata]
MATATMDPVRVGDVSFYDRYGFAVYNPESELAGEDCRTHEYNEQSDGECSKTRQFWAKMLENWEENQLFSPKQLRHFIKLGIPDGMRGEVWNKMIGSQAIKVISSFDYQVNITIINSDKIQFINYFSHVQEQNLLSSGNQTWVFSFPASADSFKNYTLKFIKYFLIWIVGSLIDNKKENMMMIDSPDTAIMTRQWKKKLQKQISVFRQIMLDIDRSFPSHKMFMEGTNEGKEGRAALFRVLAVYAMYNPQVSYCQGMSYIAGMFLMNMEEEASFWCLVSMFERPKYLAGYFNDSLGKIQRHAAVFERLMRQRRTKLYKHLEAQCVLPLMYLTPWFMALFTSLPCWDAVLAIWDMLLLEGMSVIFQVALALLDVLSVEILPLTEIAQVLPILLHPPASLVTREKLVTAIWKVKPIPKWEIDSIQAVIDEEKENLQAKRSKRSLNDHDAGNRRKKQRTLSNQPSQALPEPSFFQRFIGLFSSKEEPEIQFKTNDIEMTTFSVVSGQSPDVLMPALCCSAAGRTLNRRGSPRRPLARSRRQRNKASQRRSNNGKDMLRKRQVVCQGTLGSPVRRNQRLAGLRTPVGTKGKSPSSLVRSSATNQHAFKLFNTPTPLRRSQPIVCVNFVCRIQRHAAVFERLMRQRRTKLYKHLEAQCVLPLMYLTPWFMALFTSLPCWDAVLAIWDMLLLEGMSVIFQVALALLDVLSVEILPLTEIAQVLPILLHPPASLVTREKLVTAIWKVKPIPKWEIDSIQAVIDEEKENLQAKRSKRSLNDHDAGNRRKKQRTLSNQPSQALPEPSFFQRFIGLFSSKEEPEIQFKTNDIEMTTFSVVSGQSPDVLMPALCCSAAGRTLNRRGSPRRPLARSRRQRNKASQRRSNNGKDMLRKRQVVCQGTLGSPVRRNQRLAGLRTPVGTKGKSPSSLVRSSATNQHAFKLFNTPTPLRRSQVSSLTPCIQI